MAWNTKIKLGSVLVVQHEKNRLVEKKIPVSIWKENIDLSGYAGNVGYWSEFQNMPLAADRMGVEFDPIEKCNVLKYMNYGDIEQTMLRKSGYQKIRGFEHKNETINFDVSDENIINPTLQKINVTIENLTAEKIKENIYRLKFDNIIVKHKNYGIILRWERFQEILGADVVIEGETAIKQYEGKNYFCWWRGDFTMMRDTDLSSIDSSFFPILYFSPTEIYPFGKLQLPVM